MTKRIIRFMIALACLVVLALPAMAQESAVKGNIEGIAVDASGASVPGAKVTLTGPTGTKTVTTDQGGNFAFRLLTPGIYSVKIEKQGFKAAQVASVEVLTDKTSAIRPILEVGSTSETVEVSASAIAIDTSSTAIGANLNDAFYQNIPIRRNVSSLFYLSPGVADGGASGSANPSISGGSGLENQYVADGVDITDSAFGGLGVFSRVYGSVATGINLTFIKEVQVKTGGYEPQYGKATGGIVQIVTKSGGNDYHGSIAAFLQPRQFEAARTNADDAQFNRVNLTGKLVHDAGYDGSAELGGYVPKFKDKLFFFAAANPSFPEAIVRAPVTAGLFNAGEITARTYTYSYDGKLTYKMSEKHQIESSVFGDPTHTNVFPFNHLNSDSKTAYDTQGFGDRDWATRYNGTLSPTWVVNASFTWGNNHFRESGFDNNFSQITDITQTGLGQRGQFSPVGLGFYENTEDNTFGANVDTSKTVHVMGDQTFTVGYRYEKSFYDGRRANSGPTFNVTQVFPGTALANGATPIANINWLLVALGPGQESACPQAGGCPDFLIAGQELPVILSNIRGEYNLDPATGVKAFATNGFYHSTYFNDAWTPNKYVTMNLGVRWDEQHLVGLNSKYTFSDDWSPRLGISIDPKGDRKNKIYANFGRYSYSLPLDLAERSLTNEVDLFGAVTVPQYVPGTGALAGKNVAVVNQFGTVNPVLDPTGAHSIGTPFASQSSTEAIHSGTKLTYEDEWVVGAEHEFPQGILFTAKFIRRDLKRIVEDTGGVSPEAALFGLQQFSITNPNSKTDIATNPIEIRFPNGGPVPASCGAGAFVNLDLTFSGTDFGGYCVKATGVNGKLPGSAIADGIPDGYVNPIRRYWALEFEVNKSFSKNWQMRANYRVARLFGNYEGALRNDNGQTDPGISSLFDFTPGIFNLLGDQFKPGVLNTDRLHVINGYFSYVLPTTVAKGLSLGTGIRVTSGTPISFLNAHPIYQNAGEVPVGGRGSQGRTPITGTVDFHADYPIHISERMSLHVGADLFNIGFAKRITNVDQFNQLLLTAPLGTAVSDQDFLKPQNVNGVRSNDAFQSPFSARLFARFQF